MSRRGGGIGLGYTTRYNWERKDFLNMKAAKLVQATHTHHSSQVNKRTQEVLEALAYMRHPRSPRTPCTSLSSFEAMIPFCQLLPPVTP
jgi:hypothetical protein